MMKNFVCVLIFAAVLALSTFNSGFAQTDEGIIQDEVIYPGKDETAAPGGGAGEPVDEEGSISSDIFGKKRPYLHPFLIASGAYTDNLFYATGDEEKESDLYAIISPGIWVVVPYNRSRLIAIDTVATVPAGQLVTIRAPDRFSKFQFYAMYRPEFEIYNTFSEENTTNHRAEGFFQVNFKGGLSFDIIDRYDDAYEGRGVSVPGERTEYKSNMFQVVGRYNISPKFRVRADYSNFPITFDEDFYSFRDRTDNRLSGYLFYRVKPKTSLFTEYRFTDIKYDENGENDSVQNEIFLGVDWDITSKTHGRFKAGYGLKQFDQPGIAEKGDFVFEGTMNYIFSSKVDIDLLLFSGFRETDFRGPDYMFTYGARAGYHHKFTGKWTGHLVAEYYKDSYEGEFTLGNQTDELRDEYFQISPSVAYDFRKWLKFTGGYMYEKRDSNFRDFDYETNKFFLTLGAQY